jgi:hypothetical protein
MSFTLDKWYLDLVADDGTAVVGYAAKVAWQAFGLRYTSALLVPSASPPIEQTSLGDDAWPRFADGCVTWTSKTLGLHGEWRGLEPPIAHTLLTSPAGSIEWSCVMPRARVEVVTPSARYDGLGYAEHLRLTLPPWALPFRTLRWGRHVSDRHSLVWIEWDGEQAMRAAWLDGEPQASARVVDSGLAGLTEQRELRWRASRDLTRRAVDRLVARVAPALSALVAGRLGTMQEHKRLSPSSLLDASGQAIDNGWAIHEVVTW